MKLAILLLAACTRSDHIEARLSGSSGGRYEDLGYKATVFLGETLEVEASHRSENIGTFGVSSDSSQPRWEGVDHLEVKCTGGPCDVADRRITPHRAGEYRVAIDADGHKVTWTVTVLDVTRIEIKPCGTLAVTDDLNVGRLRVAAVTADDDRFDIAEPKIEISGTEPCRGGGCDYVRTNVPGEYDIRAVARGKSGSCHLSVVAH